MGGKGKGGPEVGRGGGRRLGGADQSIQLLSVCLENISQDSARHVQTCGTIEVLHAEGAIPAKW